MALAKAMTMCSNLYVKRPLLMNTLTMCSMYGTGDCLQQAITHHTSATNKKYKHDWVRTARMGLVGAIMGPVNHYWYLTLDTVVPSIRSMKYVAIKVIGDQICFAPVCASSFFTIFGVLEGKTSCEIKQELRLKLWPTYVMDWMVWPPAQAINFLFLPSHLRVLYVSVLTLGWNTFLSHQKHYDAHVIDEADDIKSLAAGTEQRLC